MKRILLALSLGLASASYAQATQVYSETFESTPLGDFFNFSQNPPASWEYNQTGTTPLASRYHIFDIVNGSESNRSLKLLTTSDIPSHTVILNKKIDWSPTYEKRMIIQWDYLTPPEIAGGGANCIVQFKLFDAENRAFIGFEHITKTRRVSIIRAVTQGAEDALKLTNGNTQMKRVDRFERSDNPLLLPHNTWVTFRISYDVNGVGENGTFFECAPKGMLSPVARPADQTVSDTQDFYHMPAKSPGTLGIITPAKTTPSYFNMSIETSPSLIPGGGGGKYPIVSNTATIDNLIIYHMLLATVSTAPSLSQSNLSIYPNPTSDIININPSIEVKNINIFDANGVLMAQQEASQQINIAHLPPGIYYVKYNDAKQNYSQKILKK